MSAGGKCLYCLDETTVESMQAQLGVTDPAENVVFHAIPPTAAEITSNNKNAAAQGGK